MHEATDRSNHVINRITIFDTTLRDGEQTPGVALSTRAKLKIAAMLEQLGVDVIEAGFPASSPGAAESVAAVAAQAEKASVCALARCHEGDIRVAAESLRGSRKPRLHVFIATSPGHMRHKLKLTPTQVMERAAAGIRMARELCSDVQFSAEDATRSETHFLDDIVAMAAELGVATINIPDTVGYAVPDEYARTISRLCALVSKHPGTVISAHCHDDLGLAVANSLAAVGAGARQVECTVNGIGERAGNAALEEVVMALRTRPEVWAFRTAIRTTRLCRASARVARLAGVAVAPNKAVVGANAFAHASGIHQHGVIGDASTYEVMRAEDVGARTSLVLGKQSGRHAFERWLSERGITISKPEFELVFQKFKRAADARGTVPENQILALVKGPGRGRMTLRELDATRADGREWIVAVSLADSAGRVHCGRGTGELANAIAAAIAGAAGMSLLVQRCSVGSHSLGDGTQAVAQVEFTCDGLPLTGRAMATTEYEAIAHAMMDVMPSAQPAGHEVKS